MKSPLGCGRPGGSERRSATESRPTPAEYRKGSQVESVRLRYHKLVILICYTMLIGTKAFASFLTVLSEASLLANTPSFTMAKSA